MEYFSTFLTGFGNLVTKELKKQLPDVKIRVLLDGLVVYQTEEEIGKIRQSNFLNSSFILNKQISRADINQLGENLTLANIPEGKTGFSIIYSKENQITKLPGESFEKLKQKIGQVTHLSYDPKGKLEFWVIERSEGFVFLGLRILKDKKEDLNKGQLRAELAYLMCLLSEPSSEDIFLDPFAGSGAIAIERIKIPFKKILAGDMDGKLSEKLKVKSSKLGLPITVGKWDALHLEIFEASSIDKIVTDPPWGLHLAKHLDLQLFYSKMLKEFFRILKMGGIIVILVSNKDLMEKLLRETKLFELKEKYSTLVNGQKAGVYKIKKIIMS